jgi:hypothetical protein
MPKRILFLVVFLCFSVVLSAGSVEEEGILVQATGRVRLVGSDVLSEVVISAEDKQWYVAGEDMQKLKDLQQRTITVEGEETVKELRWANGRLAGRRRYLSNIRILNVE